MSNIQSILRSKPHNPHYLNRYIKFIESCVTSDSKVERHHICPKASDLFPEYSSFTENPWNMKKLSYRQHKIAHWMLWKAYGGSQTNAFWRMSKGCIKFSRVYEKARTEFIETFSGSGNPMFGVTGENHPSFGKIHSSETREKISKRRSGYKASDKTKDILRKAQTGRIHSEESKEKRRKPRATVTCPHCGKTGGEGSMGRWHFSNCKSKQLSSDL